MAESDDDDEDKDPLCQYYPEADETASTLKSQDCKKLKELNKGKYDPKIFNNPLSRNIVNTTLQRKKISDTEHCWEAEIRCGAPSRIPLNQKRALDLLSMEDWSTEVSPSKDEGGADDSSRVSSWGGLKLGGDPWIHSVKSLSRFSTTLLG